MSTYDQRDQTVGTQVFVEVKGGEKPPSVHDLLALGVQLIEAGEYTESATVLREAIRREPTMKEIQYYLALALIKGGRPRLLPLSTIKEIESRLKHATGGQPVLQQACLLWAIVKQDYYVMNKLCVQPPSPADLLNRAGGIEAKHLNELITHIRAPGNEVWELLVRLP